MRRFFLFAFIAILFVGCSESIDTSSRYVFKDKTIAQYLEDKDYYSACWALFLSVLSPRRR